MNPPRSRRAVRRSGFVLLMVLMLLSLVAITMTGVARRSLSAAVEAAEAQEELQRRWVERTCRAAILPRAESILIALEERGHQPAPRAVFACNIAGRVVHLIVSDEQAKANVNAVIQSGDAHTAQTTLLQLVAHASAPAPIVLPSVWRQSVTASKSPRPLISAYEQVFDSVTPAQLTGDLAHAQSRELSHGLSAHLTCWSDGRLNFRRAGAPALRAICSRTLGPALAARLIELRELMPEASIGDLLEALQLDRARRQPVLDQLTDRSNCHALWIVTESDHRLYHHLAVRTAPQQTGDAKKPRKPQTSLFYW